MSVIFFNALGWISGRLDTTEEKLNKPEDSNRCCAKLSMERRENGPGGAGSLGRRGPISTWKEREEETGILGKVGCKFSKFDENYPQIHKTWQTLRTKKTQLRHVLVKLPETNQ